MSVTPIVASVIATVPVNIDTKLNYDENSVHRWCYNANPLCVFKTFNHATNILVRKLKRHRFQMGSKRIQFNVHIDPATKIKDNEFPD